MRQYQNSFAGFLTRISAFLFKEILEIMRQPMLLITLVAGPFLILFFFGIGFRNEPRALRTLFVIDEASPLNETIQQYATSLGPQLIFVGVTHDPADAEQRLNGGEVDLIVAIPSDPYNTIRDNDQAVFELLHKEIDPFQIDYINVFGRVYVDEVNRRVLRYITSAGQVDVNQIDDTLDVVDDSIDKLKDALEQCADALSELEETGGVCDTESLNQYAKELDNQIDEMEMELGDNATVSDSAQRWLRGDTTGNVHRELEPSLNRVVRNANKLGEIDDINQTADAYLDQIKTLTRMETDLVNIQERLAEFVGINPQILVSPFRSETRNIATAMVKIADYYAPAVIVMLVQHLTVTFAALSLVRERQLGSIELFTVSPISAIETLIGKYLSYLIFGGVLSVILLALLTLGMGVPLLGSWVGVALTVLSLIFTSLGIGFVISLISSTDTQAVQYSMIVLLTSVFFSGFILELRTLWQPVRIISWTLPATYGILSLRDIMLRGNPMDWLLIGQLFGIGVALLGLAWWLLRRSMQHI